MMLLLISSYYLVPMWENTLICRAVTEYLMECPFINLTSKVQPESWDPPWCKYSRWNVRTCREKLQQQRTDLIRRGFRKYLRAPVWLSVSLCQQLEINQSQNWNQPDKTISNISVCYQFRNERETTYKIPNIMLRRENWEGWLYSSASYQANHSILRSNWNILVPTGISVKLLLEYCIILALDNTSAHF